MGFVCVFVRVCVCACVCVSVCKTAHTAACANVVLYLLRTVNEDTGGKKKYEDYIKQILFKIRKIILRFQPKQTHVNVLTTLLIKLNVCTLYRRRKR